MGRLTDDLCRLRDKFCCVQKPKRCTIEDAIEDIVENLPFGEDEVIFLEETALTFQEMEGMMVAQAELAKSVVPNEIYTVLYNGRAYECKCQEIGACVIGNAEAFGGEGHGEPFVISCINETAMVISLDGAQGATVSIVGNTPIKIKQRYIDEDVYTPPTIDFVAAGCARYKQSNGMTHYTQLTAKSVKHKLARGLVRLRLEVDYAEYSPSGATTQTSGEIVVTGCVSEIILDPDNGSVSAGTVIAINGYSVIRAGFNSAGVDVEIYPLIR